MCATCKPPYADIVGSIYAAFHHGDIAYILDQLSDDVSWDADWHDNSAQSVDVGHMRPRRGPAQVAEFFALLADWQIKELKVIDIVGAGRQVAVELRLDAVLPSGGRVADEQLHLWTLDEQGQVIRFRTYADTAKVIAANAGADTVHSQGSVITGFLLRLRAGAER
ncbi:nuclear transport factor 2 family protein [Nocardia sp. NPDC052566]|uniref:nuclear transport factor 2 family protein n=1 Tax=Nocardia sp. NPDC052566 TaxID=3364330 RepID=UPI0037CAC728